MELLVQRHALLGQDNEEAVQHTPDHEVQVQAVPDAGDEPGGHRRHIDGQTLAEVAEPGSGELGQVTHGAGDADGVKNVLTHPDTQGNVPPPPVFCNILGEIGADEILGQLDAHGLGETDGHIDAAGEVAVDLDGVEQAQKQEAHAGKLSALQGADGHGDAVSDH